MDFFLVEIKCVLPELAERLCIVENMKMEHLGKKTFKLVKFMLNKVLYFINSKYFYKIENCTVFWVDLTQAIGSAVPFPLPT